MKVSFAGAELFISYLDGKATLEEVIEHKSYKAVFRHGEHFNNKLTKQDIRNALKGQSTPFYGLGNLCENLARIKNLMKKIDENKNQWLKDISEVFISLLPEGNLTNIAIFPIIGYDAGIGMGNAVCMNLNWNQYLNDYHEFLYFMIHEVFHVLYQRIHRIPPVKEVVTPEHWLSYFNLFLQNEGYAVYAPLSLRVERDHLTDRDYVVLCDRKSIEEHISMFTETRQILEQNQLSLDEYCEHVFGPERLTYRVGCELIRRIEKNYGFKAVKRGIYLDVDQFFSRYKHLLTD